MDKFKLKKKTVFLTVLLVSMATFFLGVSVLSAQQAKKTAVPAAHLSAEYWQAPLAAQGKAPQDWNTLERSLNPRSCGECHTDKFKEWSTSFHSRAFSPGLVGQLMTSFSTNPGSCMRCHAPLAEQTQAFKAALAQGRGFDKTAQGLAASGNSCAGCHLRNNRRYGPSKAGSGKTGQSVFTAPHGGVFRTRDFEKSSFCKSCHQFPPAWGAVNGKPLENTYSEWKASPQAAQGISCQNCHMPQRKHLWRGIHDPKMVKSGLTARFKAISGKARFVLLNSGVGHAFPTYVTPKVVMRAVALDAAGKPLKGTERAYVIRRSVGSGANGWYENFDTRLLPGRSATLEIPWGSARRVRMWLDIYPDDFYARNVYGALLQDMGGEARKLIVKADARASKSNFRLFVTELTKPD